MIVDLISKFVFCYICSDTWRNVTPKTYRESIPHDTISSY